MGHPDERHQALAVLIAGATTCLWLSHFIALRWPTLAGTVDLNHWIKVWNRPLTANWLSALLFFLLGVETARRISRAILIATLRRQQREAQSLSKSVGSPGGASASPDEYRQID